MSYRPTGAIVEKIDRIKEHGYPTVSAVITQAIIEFYNTLYPPYRSSGATGGSSLMSPDDRAKRTVDKREAEKKYREEMAEKEQIDLCTAMEGVIVERPDGAKLCKFYKYSRATAYEQEIDISALNDEVVRTQYSPDKETCQKAIAEKGLTKK